jgi:hypothetical protein
MKKIRKLSKDERLIMFMIVNNPPNGLKGLTKEDGIKRGPLMKKLMENLQLVNGNIDFTPVANKDLDLEENMVSLLIDCFENATFPTMMDLENANKIKKKLYAAMAV